MASGSAHISFTTNETQHQRPKAIAVDWSQVLNSIMINNNVNIIWKNLGDFKRPEPSRSTLGVLLVARLHSLAHY
jgi:hypothetical protein